MGFGGIGGLFEEISGDIQEGKSMLGGTVPGARNAQYTQQSAQQATSQQTGAASTDQLMFAALTGDIKTIKTFLISNPDINAKDKSGRTALIYAAIGASSEAISFLIQNKADPSLMDNFGKTAKEYVQFIVPNLVKLFPA